MDLSLWGSVIVYGVSVYRVSIKNSLLSTLLCGVVISWYDFVNVI